MHSATWTLFQHLLKLLIWPKTFAGLLIGWLCLGHTNWFTVLGPGEPFFTWLDDMSSFYVAPVDCLTSMAAPCQQTLLKGARAIKLFGTQVQRAPFASASSQSLRSDFLCGPAGQKHFPVFLLRPMPQIWAPFGMFQPHFEAFRPERGSSRLDRANGRTSQTTPLSYRTKNTGKNTNTDTKTN